MLKKLFWICVALYIVFLILINPQRVTFNYLYGNEVSVKVDFLILISFAAGILAVGINNFIGRSQKFLTDLFSYSANKTEKKQEEKLADAAKQIEKGDNDAAEETLTAYLKEKSDNPDVYIMLADIYLRKSLPSRAEDILKRGTSFLKDDVNILNRFGDVSAYLKKYDKALKIFEQLKGMGEDKSLYNKKMYDIYIVKKDYKNALKILRELNEANNVTGIDIEFLKVQYNYALSLIEENNFKEAEKELKQIISDDKRFYAAYVSYAELLVKKGDKKEAVNFLTDSYENTKFPYFAKMIEDVYLNDEKPQEALSFYQSQVDSIALGSGTSTGPEAWMDSQALIVYALYISLLIKLEMIDYAMEGIDNIVKTGDDKALFHLFLAECHVRHKRYEDASKQYRQFVKSRITHPIQFKCYKCGKEHEHFSAACSNCGSYNKINYFVS